MFAALMTFIREYHMRRSVLSNFLFVLVCGITAELPGAERASADADRDRAQILQVSARVAAPTAGDERRCAFLGRCGSFTLIGAKGTAAYMLGRQQYIADLVVDDEDENWWIYSPVGNSDAATTKWAFAKRPFCGKYRVLRFANGRWWRFEDTTAWGIGLGDSGAQVSSAANTGPSNQELLDSLQRIEGKLKAIQPDNQPSLSDLEKQLRKP